MKKTVSLILALLMLGSAMASCGKTDPAGETTGTETSLTETLGETNAPETSTAETGASETNPAETGATETDPVDPDFPYYVKDLTINGTNISEYVISCNASAEGVISYAASELQKYIELTTGVSLTIAETPVEAGVKRISIDETVVSDANNFKIYSDADGIVLAGSAKRSALYAVYSFLENCLGWTFYAADTEICDKVNALDVSNVNIDFVHSFEIRDIYWTEYFDEDISVKRYINGDGKRRKMYNDNPESVKYGGSENFHPYGIHTFASLTGQDDSQQPCLNNTSVYKKLKKSVIAWLQEDPTRKMIHVSQNDNQRYCTCDKCQADIDTYGSPAGSIIKLVNKLDEDLKKEGLEDITIITFAYQYSFPCPTGITCNEDIAIELCTIDYCFNHAFDDPNCEKNKYCMDQIKAWSEICTQFYVWDYTVDFKYYLNPFPNFDVLLDNIRVLSSVGAKGIMEQGNYQTPSAEFGALRCYLIAKALENPNMTKEEYYGHMDAFLEAYYGPGWTYIRQFIDLITELSNEKNNCFGIFASPEDIYGEHPFSPYNEQLIEWWDKAVEMAETDLQLEHVRRSRLCCDYIRLGSIFEEQTTTGGYDAIKQMRADNQAFFERLKELGITRIAENFALPETIDNTINVRAWWNLHEYQE